MSRLLQNINEKSGNVSKAFASQFFSPYTETMQTKYINQSPLLVLRLEGKRKHARLITFKFGILRHD